MTAAEVEAATVPIRAIRAVVTWVRETDRREG